MMRISTAGMFAQGTNALQLRQSELARTQLQLSTGNRLLSAKDDPVAAGMSLMLDRATAALQQFGRNADSAAHRLRLEESALTSANDRITRIRELAVQSNSGSQSPDSRNAIVLELSAHLEALVAEANSSDGSGRFLFGGTADGSPPFSVSSGMVVYSGDQTQRRVEIAPGLTVADGDPGSEVFQRVRTGRDGVAMRADPGNLGSAFIVSSGVSDATQWDGDAYRVRFNAGIYEVLDSSSTVIATNPYVSGEPIVFRGVHLTMRGAPANGDIMHVDPAPNQDVFTTVQKLIDTLQLPVQSEPQRAEMQNRIYAALEDLTGAQDHLIDQRAQLGARLSTIELAGEEREAIELEHRSLISELRDLDYAEAASRMSLQLTALEAAQASFVRIQSLSLFDLMR